MNVSSASSGETAEASGVRGAHAESECDKCSGLAAELREAEQKLRRYGNIGLCFGNDTGKLWDYAMEVKAEADEARSQLEEEEETVKLLWKARERNEETVEHLLNSLAGALLKNQALEKSAKPSSEAEEWKQRGWIDYDRLSNKGDDEQQNPEGAADQRDPAAWKQILEEVWAQNGAEAESVETLVTAVLLSNKMKRLAGKSSHAHRVFLEAALSDPMGICNSGILLSIDGVETLVTAVLEDPIGDELDLKSSLDVKGSSGVKPCFKCTNVCMRDHDGSTLPGHVDITCTDASEFSSMTDADLYEASDAVLTVARTKRESESKHWGVNYSPHGVLQSALVRSRMRPTRSRFDRMHVVESKGIAEMEINLLIESLADDKKFSNKEVADFCNAGWITQWGDKQAKKVRISIRDNKLKGMASDVLNAMPILYSFVCTCLQDWDTDKVESFKALYAVVAQLQRIKFSGDCSKDATDKLARVIALHCRLFKKAHGAMAVKPKHHYAFHLPQQFYLDGIYVDCFAMERMHALMKAESELVDDTSAPKSEFWVLSKANRVLIEEAKTLNVQPHGQAITVNGEPAESVTRFAYWRGRYAKGHVILIDDIPCMVDLCVKFRDRWGLVVEKLRKHRDVHTFASEWRRQPGNRTLHVLKELWICFNRFFSFGLFL